jgi:hypothetical protein
VSAKVSFDFNQSPLLLVMRIRLQRPDSIEFVQKYQICWSRPHLDSL